MQCIKIQSILLIKKKMDIKINGCKISTSVTKYSWYRISVTKCNETCFKLL